MSSTTLKELFEDFAEEFSQGKLGVTTATGDDTSVIDLTRFGRPSAGNEWARNTPLRITARAAVASGDAVPGNEVYVSDFLPSAGDFTVSPAMTATPRVGTSFIVTYPGGADSTERWLEALNRFLLRTADRRQRIPFTFVPNGDYFATATTGWTATNASTPAYANLAHPDGYYHRVLVVTASAADGRLTSTTLKTSPGDVWDFYTFNRVTTAGDVAELVIFDESNSAAITPTFEDGLAEYSGLSFQDILGKFTIPSGCYQISFRLQSQANGDVSHWGPIVAAPQNTRTYTGQSALEYLQDAGAFLSFEVGDHGPQERHWYPVPKTHNDDMLGFGQGFTFGAEMPFPLFCEMLMPYPAMVGGSQTALVTAAAASEDDTTSCPKSLALAGMAVEFFTYMQREERLERGPDNHATRWDGMLQDAQAKLITAQTSWDAPRRITVRKHFAGRARA